MFPFGLFQIAFFACMIFHHWIRYVILNFGIVSEMFYEEMKWSGLILHRMQFGAAILNEK